MNYLLDILEKAKSIYTNDHLSDYDKDVALATLMTLMENRYDIPLLRNPEWESKNPKVISIYREISNMRKL